MSGINPQRHASTKLSHPSSWEDYKAGRAARENAQKEEEQEEDQPAPIETPENDQRTEAETPEDDCIPEEKEIAPQPTKAGSVPKREGWRCDRTAKFSWRLGQVVQEESNWRGTWVLEVKDMGAMGLGYRTVPKDGGRAPWEIPAPANQAAAVCVRDATGRPVCCDNGGKDQRWAQGKRSMYLMSAAACS